MYYIYSGDLKGLRWSHLSLSISGYPVNIQLHTFLSVFFGKKKLCQYVTVNNLFIVLYIKRPGEMVMLSTLASCVIQTLVF